MNNHEIVNTIENKDNYTTTYYYDDGSIVIYNTILKKEVVRITSQIETVYFDDGDVSDYTDYTVYYNGEEYSRRYFDGEDFSFEYNYNLNDKRDSLIIKSDFDDMHSEIDLNNKIILDIYEDNKYYSNIEDKPIYSIVGNKVYVYVDDYDEPLTYIKDYTEVKYEESKLMLRTESDGGIFEYEFENNRRVSEIGYEDDGVTLWFTKKYNDDGSVQTNYRDGTCEIHYPDDSWVFYEEDNTIYKYYKDNLYYKIDPDGTGYFYPNELFDLGHSIRINNDGTLSKVIYDEENDNVTYESIGKYEHDKNNNLVAYVDGRTYYLDKYYGIDKIVEANGDVKTYNFDNDQENKIHNGKVSYSMINHIEYDEDEYDNIMKSLIKLYEDNINLVESKYNNILKIYNDIEFNDDIDSKKNKALDNLDRIDILKKHINYSLLTYQACDKELLEQANILVDQLFDNEQSFMVKNFLNNVSNTIGDEDLDGIIEYKKETNFKVIFNNTIPDHSYIDESGNILWFNRNNNLIDIQGNDVSFNYGNESFSLDYSNGYPILLDSKGNNVDIFADYNLQADQYGGNQDVFMIHYLMFDDPNIKKVLDRYFPNTTEEERLNLLSHIGATGCGYVAFANILFKKFEGKEQKFYETFGYPMYNVSYQNLSSEDEQLYDDIGYPEGVIKGLSIDYNYEPLALDLYCFALSDRITQMEINDNVTSNNRIKDAARLADGFYKETPIVLKRYLKYKYGVDEINNCDENNPIKYLSSEGYDLYTMDGELYLTDGGCHAMIITGEKDGRYIVSTWGEKYYVDFNRDKDYWEIVNY